MTDQWTDRLSEFVDGDLDAATTAAAEAHLAVCTTCAETVAELRAVANRAGALSDREPARDLWPGIAERLERKATVTAIATRKRMRERRVTFTVPQLAAAGLALLLVSAGTVWVAVRSDESSPVGPAATAAPVVAVSATGIVAGYEPAVRDLEQVLAEHRDRLDPETVRVIETSLATIDRAIADAIAALEVDPANPYLTGHLTNAMQRKLEVLELAAALAATSS